MIVSSSMQGSRVRPAATVRSLQTRLELRQVKPHGLSIDLQRLPGLWLTWRNPKRLKTSMLIKQRSLLPAAPFVTQCRATLHDSLD